MMGVKGYNIFIKGIRNIIQVSFLALTVGIGLQFFIFVLQAYSDADMTVSRPPGVEAFLPIGSLMGWKLFFTEGKWDITHPAAMVIIGFAVLVSILYRKSFCGWICPVGTISEWLWKMGTILFGRNIKLPKVLDYILRSLKYLILGFFIYIIFSMPSGEIENFLESPYYKMSDVKMLFFFTRMTMTTLIVLVFLVIASLIIKNFWCRYLCPYGGLLGLLALFSPTKIERHINKCINCGKCSKNCPYNLPVDIKQKIKSPECNGCMECVKACPVENTLHMKTFGRVITPSRLAVIVSLMFILIVYLAQITGHWKSNVQEHEFRTKLRSIDGPGYTHPRTLMMNNPKTDE